MEGTPPESLFRTLRHLHRERRKFGFEQRRNLE
jgi:hypothetical protein